jgi:predicted kinase
MSAQSKSKEKFLLLIRGLGGTGKTTLSTFLSKELHVPVLNRDDVKMALADFNFDLTLQSEIGYRVMNELAAVQLRNGISVILDANARFRSMQEFYENLVLKTGSRLFVINCFCSDENDWAKRIQNRGSSHPISFAETKSMSIEGFELKDQLQFDSATMSAEEVLAAIQSWLRKDW